MIASIIPYPQILCISNYVVVLNEEYLRDDLSTAAFKYGGKIKVVGYVTNKVVAQSNTHVSAFAGIGNSINALVKIFFENAEAAIRRYESDELIVAARMPAITKPARIAGSELVESVINMFSAADFVRCSVGKS